MRLKLAGSTIGVVAALGIGAAMLPLEPALRAQQPPPPSGGQGGGRGVITSPRNAYPERTPDDPAAVARGKALYGVNCQFCHGADIRGGDGGPSLLRSGLVLDDQHGELIAPVVQNGRTDRGMPKFAFTNEQAADVAGFLHTFKAAGYDESRRRPPSILVGDAKAGEAFFAARCGSCHSATGDLRGIATRIEDHRLLQQTWLMPGSGAGRGSSPPVKIAPTRVVVTPASGEKVEGVLDRLDDFFVSLTTDAGEHRSFRLSGDARGVEVKDPLQPHMNLLRTYTDADIHNVTAYLVTLK
jgi:mono/diheme cytochrome c family protein